MCIRHRQTPSQGGGQSSFDRCDCLWSVCGHIFPKTVGYQSRLLCDKYFWSWRWHSNHLSAVQSLDRQWWLWTAEKHRSKVGLLSRLWKSWCSPTYLPYFMQRVVHYTNNFSHVTTCYYVSSSANVTCHIKLANIPHLLEQINKLTSVCHASFLLLIMNIVITLSKKLRFWIL